MSEYVSISWSVIPWAVGGGVLAAVIFFGGLWITVRKIPDSNSPAGLVFLSTILRMGAAFGIFYLVSKSGSWIAVLIAVAVFVLCRFAAIGIVRSEERHATDPRGAKEELSRR